MLAVLSLLLCWAPARAQTAAMERALAKLSPDERTHQLCILRGLDAVRREPRLRNADRMKTSIFTPAVLQGTVLTAKGGAVRAGEHWYALSFTCQLSTDLMKATAFNFALGGEIPKTSWDQHGLWR